LDKSAHPGRPGTDELVPSRYALRVGDIDVLVVSDGRFRCSRNWGSCAIPPARRWRCCGAARSTT
jgi:hypothetical protein